MLMALGKSNQTVLDLTISIVSDDELVAREAVTTGHEALNHSCVSNEPTTTTTGLAQDGCQQLLIYHSEPTADHPERSGFPGHIPADATLIL